MTLSLEELITHVQTIDWKTEAGQRKLNQLVNQILRTRRFCRSSNPSSESNAVKQINQQLRSHLRQDLAQSLAHYSPRNLSAEEWLESKRCRTYKAVLNNQNLTQLACAAQQYQPGSAARRHALNDLIEAIRLSGQLAQQHRYSCTYEEAVSITLLHVYEKIDQYRPDAAPVMAWVNYWLKIHLRQVEKEQSDPMGHCAMDRRIRAKGQLKRNIKSIRVESIYRWLTLAVRSAPTEPLIYPTIFKLLVSCLWMSDQMRRFPGQVDDFLFELVDQLLVLPTHVDSLDEKPVSIAQEASPPSLSEQIRQYFTNDLNGLCQVHIRNRPEITFQKIALAYLDGTPWQVLSDQFNLPISTLSTFYQRQLQKIAPDIRNNLTD